jgi:hypothetical protein
VQKAFDDRLEVLAGRISSSEFFAGLPALNLLVTGGLNSVPIALKLNSSHRNDKGRIQGQTTTFYI